jgi:O-methyltransferase
MLGRARRAVRLLHAAYREATFDERYHPVEAFGGGFLELKAFMRKAFQVLKFNEIDGDYAEFGVCGARTFTLAWGAAQLVRYPVRMWAFDSFEGLPAAADPRDAHPKWNAEACSMSEERFRQVCTSYGVPAGAYVTVPGYYNQTLAPDAAGARPDKIAFAYVDCDLYSSTVDVLRFLWPRLRHGMIIAFDDWFCYSSTMPSGERLAASEFFDNSADWQLLPFVQYGWHGMSFVVERTAPPPAASTGFSPRDR